MQQHKIVSSKSLATVLSRNALINGNPVHPVFTPLNYLFSSLSAASIANILNKSIQLAGLDGLGYSAKSFRPTGAMAVIAAGVKLDSVRTTGRWKSQECSETHYVHAKPPQCMTDNILLS